MAKAKLPLRPSYPPKCSSQGVALTYLYSNALITRATTSQILLSPFFPRVSDRVLFFSVHALFVCCAGVSYPSKNSRSEPTSREEGASFGPSHARPRPPPRESARTTSVNLLPVRFEISFCLPMIPPLNYCKDFAQTAKLPKPI